MDVKRYCDLTGVSLDSVAEQDQLIVSSQDQACVQNCGTIASVGDACEVAPCAEECDEAPAMSADTERTLRWGAAGGMITGGLMAFGLTGLAKTALATSALFFGGAGILIASALVGVFVLNATESK